MSGALDAADLGRRFRRARLAAIAQTIGAARGERRNGDPAGAELDELASVPDSALEELSRRVYWNAWRLGASAAFAHGRVNDTAALQRLLASGLELDCLCGAWRADGGTRRLERPGCAAGRALGARACDFAREAVDGLVAGLSHELRFARHTSVGHGAAACSDVLYRAGADARRFEAPPAEVCAYLARPLERLAELGVRVEVLGLAEDRLHVRLESAHGAGCGPTKLYFDLLARHLAQAFPRLVLVDASPRAVLA